MKRLVLTDELYNVVLQYLSDTEEINEGAEEFVYSNDDVEDQFIDETTIEIVDTLSVISPDVLYGYFNDLIDQDLEGMSKLDVLTLKKLFKDIQQFHEQVKDLEAQFV